MKKFYWNKKIFNNVKKLGAASPLLLAPLALETADVHHLHYVAFLGDNDVY